MSYQNKEIPKYKQIESYFIEKMNDGSLNHGDKIMTEQEMVDYFKTSRMTVNKAITGLADKGYIKRVSGVGSFINNQVLKKPLNLNIRSMTEDIESSGMKAGTVLLEYHVIRGKDKPNVAKLLDIKDEEFIHYFSRIRTADDVPVALSYSFISSKIVPELNVIALEGSLDKYLTSLGVARFHCDAEFAAVLPTEEHKNLLDIKDGALLKRTLLWYTKEMPFEYTIHYLLGNRFAITHSLEAIIKSD